MSTYPTLLAFWRHNGAWFPIVIGLFTGLACWWLLPVSPRRSLPLPLDDSRSVVLSPDFRYAAIINYELSLTRQIHVQSEIWDLTSCRSLFSFPFEKGPDGSAIQHSLAISPDNKLVVEFPLDKPGRATAKFRKIPSGDLWEPGAPIEFPIDVENGITSRLTIDARGRLLVAILDKSKPSSIRDLLTGKEVGTLPKWDSEWALGLVPGCNMRWVPNTGEIEVRALPSGDIRGHLPANLLQGLLPQREVYSVYFNCALTPDCNTLAKIDDGKIHVWDVSSRHYHFVNREASQFVGVSPDGRFLASQRFLPGAWHPDPIPWAVPWLDWLMPQPRRSSGEWVQQSEVVLYDLIAQAEVTSFGLNHANPGHQNPARFSLDGQSLAIIGPDALELYDLPLRRPWSKIVGCALLAAASLWLVGWFLERRRRMP
jgi:hypothetical protein